MSSKFKIRLVSTTSSSKIEVVYDELDRTMIISINVSTPLIDYAIIARILQGYLINIERVDDHINHTIIERMTEICDKVNENTRRARGLTIESPVSTTSATPVIRDLVSHLVDFAIPRIREAQSVQSSQSDIPQKFTEDRKSSKKEVIIQQVTESSLLIDNQKQTMCKKYTSLSEDTLDIKLLAKTIYNFIINKKSPHPDFTKKTKANRKKIKNYIYHITGIYVSKQEIVAVSSRIQNLLLGSKEIII